MLDAVTVTEAAPGHSNDDYLLVAGRWAIVLDGVSRHPVDDIGCEHGVGWYVPRLGTLLGAAIEAADPGTPMEVLLARAIERTTAGHNITCDLDNPFTPAATVAAVRLEEDRLDWLVLGDAAVAWRLSDGTAHAVSDDRLEKLPVMPIVDGEFRRRDPHAVIAHRNKPGGYWVAASDPAAAKESLTGSVPTERLGDIALFSDGVTRLVERYDRTWRDLFELAAAEGVRALVETVRAEEEKDPEPDRWLGKKHDDATAVMASLRRR
ncbi:hypothetical protein Afil01_30260 [Actinorhabdospora filicis]|uniref:PPM-type phosphatase domain-containing protein n=1 Tax=Actinorhabdospora filicis TaxID=1785913 RepID=A0A9W6SLZ5_9ACTN|nr:protein phosphatase 2C domain-containing protein [Actinorhabdospora filicis]GLZ78219.1 hypothetical protein Afil01_30260 [Actinorhabdospora filicis]